jgi:hypothetical protein
VRPWEAGTIPELQVSTAGAAASGPLEHLRNRRRQRHVMAASAIGCIIGDAKVVLSPAAGAGFRQE